jgi:LacI family transcriptional regulator, galactose operon repressor
MRSRSANKRVTLGDVARTAGVSVMTVSNVVRGKTQLVKGETRERVQKVIAELHYRPNVSARSLRLSQDYSVGIVISDSDPAFLNDPFISRLVSGLSNYLSALDYTLDVQGVTPGRFENATILSKVGNDAFCAILCGPAALRRRQLGHLQRYVQPVVAFQEVARSVPSNVALVRQDDFGGGKLLGQHLLQRRVRSVVFLRPKLDWCAVEQREKGIRQVLAAARPAITASTVVAPSESFEDVQSVVAVLLATKPPDAIAAATDSMAVAVLKACEEKGIRVPQDLLVTGFNGFDAWRHTSPTLTTVVSPAYEMGQYAGELLVNRLRSSSFSKATTVFPVTLQPGGST